MGWLRSSRLATPLPPTDAPNRSRNSASGVSAGLTYRIAVKGVADPSTGQVENGNVWLQLFLSSGYPQNDNFANPFTLLAIPDAQPHTLNTYEATKEFGEPEHAGDPGGASVWYSWTPPESGLASVNTCGSSFDTLLAVYTGASVRALTPVAASDDSLGPTCPFTAGSEVKFRVTAGSTYRIAVDGAGGSAGQLALSDHITPDPDTVAPGTSIRRFRVKPRKRWAKFYFRGSEREVGFRCKLDRYPWEECTSPAWYTRLRLGRHTFRVAARDTAGNVDPTPARRRWRIRG